MSTEIDDNIEIKEPVKANWFRRVLGAIWKFLKFLYSKCKAVFIFLAAGIISLFFIGKISRTSVKTAEKKKEIKEEGETVSDTITDLKEELGTNETTIKETETILDESSKKKEDIYEDAIDDQKAKAENLGFKKVD